MLEEENPPASKKGASSRPAPARSGAVLDPARRRRRENFLADLAEAQQLRERVAPRRTRMARLRQQHLMRTFLY
jgi:hypothetical protein